MKKDLYNKIVNYILENQDKFYRILIKESLLLLKSKHQKELFFSHLKKADFQKLQKKQIFILMKPGIL